MKPHILRTKLQRPAVAPDILPRPRLLVLFSRAETGGKSMEPMVTFPAG